VYILTLFFYCVHKSLVLLSGLFGLKSVNKIIVVVITVRTFPFEYNPPLGRHVWLVHNEYT